MFLSFSFVFSEKSLKLWPLRAHLNDSGDSGDLADQGRFNDRLDSLVVVSEQTDRCVSSTRSV